MAIRAKNLITPPSKNQLVPHRISLDIVDRGKTGTGGLSILLTRIKGSFILACGRRAIPTDAVIHNASTAASWMITVKQSRINNQNEATSRATELTEIPDQGKTSFVSYLSIATKKYPQKSGGIYPQ